MDPPCTHVETTSHTSACIRLPAAGVCTLRQLWLLLSCADSDSKQRKLRSCTLAQGNIFHSCSVANGWLLWCRQVGAGVAEGWAERRRAQPRALR